MQVYNRAVSCIVEFTGHMLSDRDTTSIVREWEREGMGINNQWQWEGNGNKCRLNLGSGFGNGNGNEPLGMGGNEIEKDISAHLYSSDGGA